jgi:4-amino-4-deoxy-L-arabinose transferase-like glycosyltransferase
MQNISIPKFIKDIRFWILLFFVVRLVGITNPPLELGHNWRQSFTAMVARNMVEQGPDLLHPKADYLGNSEGVIASEFPIFNYLIYAVSKVFDYDHWYGRLINLIVSSFGLFYFYKISRQLFNTRVAFNATLILTSSIWFAFSRKIMPDTFSISLLMIGAYGGIDYLQKSRISGLFAFFIFCTLGMLSKIPALSLFCAFAVVPVIKGLPKRNKLILSLTALASVIVVLGWYFVWVPHLIEKYNYSLYESKGMIEGFYEVLPLLGPLAEKFYFSAFHSFVASLCFLIGVYYLVKKKSKILQLALIIITCVFCVFIVKTGAIFPTHNYYIIPFVPVMALIASFSITKLPPKFSFILLAIILAEGIANQQHDFKVPSEETYKLELESLILEHLTEEKLIIINGGPSPQDIYFAHRKGWSVQNEVLFEPLKLDSLKQLGGEYLIVNKHNLNSGFDAQGLVFENQDYSFYKL